MGVRRGRCRTDPLERAGTEVVLLEDPMIWLQSLRKRDEGQDLLEYAMLASLIAIVALASLGLLADQIINVFWGSIANLKF